MSNKPPDIPNIADSIRFCKLSLDFLFGSARSLLLTPVRQVARLSENYQRLLPQPPDFEK
jgi:hypothetical protein